jgi:hypothetical protein
MQGKQKLALFMEADINNVNEFHNPIIAFQQDAGLVYSAITLMHTGTYNNDLVISTSSNVGTEDGDIYFRTGGSHIVQPIGTMITSFTIEPIDAVKINSTNQRLISYGGIESDNITEQTSGAGVTIEGTRMENSGINLTPTTSNPGGPNTIWQRTSDGHLFRGSVDLEA